MLHHVTTMITSPGRGVASLAPASLQIFAMPCAIIAYLCVQLSEASAYEAQVAEASQDPRYSGALPLPRPWDQPQSGPASSSAQGPQPWWEVKALSHMQTFMQKLQECSFAALLAGRLCVNCMLVYKT